MFYTCEWKPMNDKKKRNLEIGTFSRFLCHCDVCNWLPSWSRLLLDFQDQAIPGQEAKAQLSHSQMDSDETHNKIRYNSKKRYGTKLLLR